jgi:hypothetical protein
MNEFTKEQRLRDLIEIQRLELAGLHEVRSKLFDCGPNEEKVASYLEHYNKLSERTKNRSEAIEVLVGVAPCTTDVYI